MKIIIQTIPHTAQAYETCGDWRFEKDGTLNIYVSDLKNEKMSFLIGMHEAIEAFLCKSNGVKQKDVDAFDIEFEKIRELYPDTIGNHEPGDMISAPYHKEHTFATIIEKMIAYELGVDWKSYDKKVSAL